MVRRRDHWRGECAGCVFWEETDDRSDEGFQNEGICRRHPPVAIPSSDIDSEGLSPERQVGVRAAWPRTFAEQDWCGEFKEIPDWGPTNRDQRIRELEFLLKANRKHYERQLKAAKESQAPKTAEGEQRADED